MIRKVNRERLEMLLNVNACAAGLRGRQAACSAGLIRSYTIVDYKLEHYFSLTPNQPTVNNPRSFTTKRTGSMTPNTARLHCRRWEWATVLSCDPWVLVHNAESNHVLNDSTVLLLMLL